MSGLSHPSVNKAVMFLGLIVAAGSGMAAIWFFAEAAGENGSHAGNILRVGLGILSLLICALILGVGAIYLKSRNDRSRSQSHY